MHAPAAARGARAGRAGELRQHDAATMQAEHHPEHQEEEVDAPVDGGGAHEGVAARNHQPSRVGGWPALAPRRRAGVGHPGAGSRSMMSASTRSTSLRDRVSASTGDAGTSRWASTGAASDFEIVGQHVVAAVGQRRGAGRVAPGELAARRDAQRQVRRPARLARDRDDVVGELGATGARARRPPAAARTSATDSTGSRRASVVLGAPGRLQQDAPLVLGRRVVDADAQQEAIHLRLGQRVGAVVLLGVLRGDDQERLRRAGGSRPSTETWPSFIASSSALCVRGVVRLISSASTRFAKIGPGPELELARSSGRGSTRRARPRAAGRS